MGKQSINFLFIVIVLFQLLEIESKVKNKEVCACINIYTSPDQECGALLEYTQDTNIGSMEVQYILETCQKLDDMEFSSECFLEKFLNVRNKAVSSFLKCLDTFCQILSDPNKVAKDSLLNYLMDEDISQGALDEYKKDRQQIEDQSYCIFKSAQPGGICIKQHDNCDENCLSDYRKLTVCQSGSQNDDNYKCLEKFYLNNYKDIFSDLNAIEMAKCLFYNCMYLEGPSYKINTDL